MFYTPSTEEYLLHVFSVAQTHRGQRLLWTTTGTALTKINFCQRHETQQLNKEFSVWAKTLFSRLLLLIHTESQTWWGIHTFHLSAMKCFKPERNTTQGQDYRSAQHNGLIMGENVWTPSCALVSPSVEGNVRVQDTVFTAGSSGNWNVSFFSTATQSSVDPAGMEHGMDNLKVKNFNSRWCVRVCLCLYVIRHLIFGALRVSNVFFHYQLIWWLFSWLID